MKISELIKKLESFQQKYGDFEIKRYGENEGGAKDYQTLSSIWHAKIIINGEIEEIAVLV